MSLIQCYLKMEKIWFLLPEKIRFLLVGGFNTLVSYMLFVFMVVVCDFKYQTAIVIGYIISVNVSIFTMRRYVFRSGGKWYKEYSKGWGVYLTTMFLNFAAMFLMVDICMINELAAQAVFTVVITVLTYLLHRYFTFKSSFK